MTLGEKCFSSLSQFLTKKRSHNGKKEKKKTGQMMPFFFFFLSIAITTFPEKHAEQSRNVLSNSAGTGYAKDVASVFIRNTRNKTEIVFRAKHSVTFRSALKEYHKTTHTFQQHAGIFSCHIGLLPGLFAYTVAPASLADEQSPHPNLFSQPRMVSFLKSSLGKASRT